MPRNPKFEYLNPKQILNSNFSNISMMSRLEFSFSDLFRVSDLGFRYFSTEQTVA